jgi:hypothetical protein
MTLAYIDAGDVQGPHGSAFTRHVQRIHLLRDLLIEGGWL